MVGTAGFPGGGHHGDVVGGGAFDYYVVIDFECTCQRNDAAYPHEIIEFPVVLVDGETLEVVEKWREFVRPVLNPRLTDFCTQLTGIRQDTVDDADVLAVVLRRFHAWLGRMGLLDDHIRIAFVTDGPSDFRDFYFRHSVVLQRAVNTHYPYFNQWIDLKLLYAQHTGRHHASLKTMLREMGLQFLGIPHCGIDDAANIARVFTGLLRQGVDVGYTSAVEDEVLSYLFSLPMPARNSASRRRQRQQIRVTHPSEHEDPTPSPPPLCPAPQLAAITSPASTTSQYSAATPGSGSDSGSSASEPTPRPAERLNPNSLPYRPSHSLSSLSGSSEELNPNSPPYRPAHVQAALPPDQPQQQLGAPEPALLNPESTPYRPSGAYNQHELNPHRPPYRPANSSDESADESLGPEEEEQWGKHGWGQHPGHHGHGWRHGSHGRGAGGHHNSYRGHGGHARSGGQFANHNNGEGYGMHNGHWGQWGMEEAQGYAWSGSHGGGMRGGRHRNQHAASGSCERSYIFYPGQQRSNAGYSSDALEWG